MTQRLDHRTLAVDGMRAMGRVYEYVARSGLPKALVDLVYLRVSQINGCAFCVDAHARDLLDAGVAVEKVVMLPVWREGGTLFSASERAALEWAESVTRIADRGAPDDVFAPLAAVFEPKEIVDLTIAIGLINAYNRLAIGFRTTPAGIPAD